MAKNIAAAIVCVSGIGLVGLAMDRTAHAQCDHSLTTYASSDLEGSGAVSALTVFDDGSGPALVAGGFELLMVPGGSSIDVYNIAKWSPNNGWIPLAAPNELYYVRDLQVFDGHLYATAYSGSGVPQRWTGTEWVAVGEGMQGSAGDMVVFDDGSGTGQAMFVLVNGSPSRLLKLTGGTWEQIAAFRGAVSTAEVFNGRLIVAGSIKAVNGIPVNRIAAWDGQQWADWGGGVLYVTDLIEHQVDGAPALVACGTFELGDDDGKTTDVAYWDGTGWRGLPAINFPEQDDIGPMTVWDNGNGNGPALYAAVTTQSASSGDHYGHLLRLDPLSQQWQHVGTTYYLPDSGIRCMAAYDEGASDFSTLFVGGKFMSFGGVDTYSLARVLPETQGGGIHPLPSDPRSLRGSMQSLATFGDGGVYAGGRFLGLHHTSDTLVAYFTGKSWTGIGWTPYGYGGVSILKALDDGSGPALYAAGSFTPSIPTMAKRHRMLRNGTA